jgi:hypothetical protein
MAIVTKISLPIIDLTKFKLAIINLTMVN